MQVASALIDRYASKALSWLFLLNVEDFNDNSPRASEIWKHLYKSGFYGHLSIGNETHHPKEADKVAHAMHVIPFHSSTVTHRKGSRASQRTKILGVLVSCPMCIVHWRTEKARKEGRWNPDIGVGRSWTECEYGILDGKNSVSKGLCSLPISTSQLVLVREYHPGGHRLQNSISWMQFEKEISTCQQHSYLIYTQCKDIPYLDD